MELNGKVVVVTGGASGLGAATARMLRAAGAKPVIFDINEVGAILAAELDGTFFKVDVSSALAVEAAMKATGTIHGAVNCAGIGPPARIISKDGPASLELFEKVIRINLIGTYNVIRLAAWAMSQNEPNGDGERGVIINTASVAAYDGQIGQSAYSASKGGIVGMTLPIARDLSRNGIRVMTIAPGLFDTPLLAGLPEAARLALGEMVPFPPRLGKTSEYAQLARQIFENPMLNGEVIRLDGALRMAPK